MMESSELTGLVREKARELGFSRCGFAPVSDVASPVSDSFRTWLDNSYNAGMDYMNNYTDKRLSPGLLVDGAVSVVSFALNYYPERKIDENSYQLSYYAYGRDYHDVMKSRLLQVAEYMQTLAGRDIGFRVFCDTAPVLERYWAWRAGLGWIGKNTNLIIPGMGSYFFLGEIFCNLSFEYDSPMDSRCGNCTRCLDNCPTDALAAGKTLDARKCLSYLTIENRGEIPVGAAEVMGNRIYGCDTCQKVCPWNRFACATTVRDFEISDRLLGMTAEKWETLTVEDYRILFKGSAVKRAKFEGLKRNIDAVAGMWDKNKA